MLAKIRSYIDFNSALTIYKTMILPIFEYGDIPYDQADFKSLDKLQTFQNRALRININRNVHISRIRMHQECNIAILKVRRIVHLRMFIFKQCENETILNLRPVNSRAHDAALFNTERPETDQPV